MMDGLKIQKVIPQKVNKQERAIAYFSMEIGLDQKIPTYSGGLGILAGDTIKSCADLHVPLTATTLLYRKGYFRQELTDDGWQTELPWQWNPDSGLKLLPEKVQVEIEGRPVFIQAWQYIVVGVSGYSVPVIFLDTALAENSGYDQSLSDYLYGGDLKYRFCQEIILGIGGFRMLRALGYTNIKRYHMNEGHASLLTLEILQEKQTIAQLSPEIDEVKNLCVFTTHTPVPAGHDKFPYDMVQQVLRDYVSFEQLKALGGNEKLNMTYLALNLSNYINGVAKEHGKVSREMFPGYFIDSITNGVHSATWVCKSFRKLFDHFIPGWTNDPFSMRYALNIPQEPLWNAHMDAKKLLINYVNNETNVGMDYDSLTIGFARRATAYKRADLIFFSPQRLIDIVEKVGKLQFIYSGKAHPQDYQGKELIRHIVSISKSLKDKIKIVYLANYEMELAKLLVSGVDVWLNTPQKPREASGTSGMKAAHNGVPSFSILDGWWIEGCIEGVTGWAIGSAEDDESRDEDNIPSLYDKIEQTIAPMFYNNRQGWINVMRHAIAINASFFNTHRMVQQYVLNAYLY